MFRGAKKRTFRFGKKNVSFPKVETFRFADYTCGGSPVDKALAKLDDAIEKLEKKGDKMTKDEMDAIMKDLEEPVSVLNKTIEDNEVGGVTKIKIIAKVTKLTALATKVGIKNLDMGDFSDKAKGTKKE